MTWDFWLALEEFTEVCGLFELFPRSATDTRRTGLGSRGQYRLGPPYSSNPTRCLPDPDLPTGSLSAALDFGGKISEHPALAIYVPGQPVSLSTTDHTHLGAHACGVLLRV